MNTPADKASAVREMFGVIAGRYDFLNHFLSGNADRRWRETCVKKVARRAAREPRILDVGCGTADLSVAFSSVGPVVGCDFCHPMLRLGMEKVAQRWSRHEIHLTEGDALKLPFAAGTFDVVVSAFVLRNLASMEKGLAEMRRVLRPSGVVGILDFAMPRTPILSSLYRLYFTRVLPTLGRWISGVEGPYQYLPQSVQAFPPPEELEAMIIRSGFRDVECHLLTAGIAFLFVAGGA